MNIEMKNSEWLKKLVKISESLASVHNTVTTDIAESYDPNTHWIIDNSEALKYVDDLIKYFDDGNDIIIAAKDGGVKLD